MPDGDAQQAEMASIVDGDDVPPGLDGPPVTDEDLAAAAQPIGEDQ